MRASGRVIALLALWVLAWGSFSVTSVISGIIVASALLVAFPMGPRSDVRFHPVGIAKLVVYIGAQLVTANVAMSREVLRRRPSLEPGVIAHRLRVPSDEVVTVMTSVIALSPGTMTVDTAADSSMIYVHFLMLDDVDAAQASLDRLERLVVGAIGGDRDRSQRTQRVGSTGAGELT